MKKYDRRSTFTSPGRNRVKPQNFTDGGIIAASSAPHFILSATFLLDEIPTDEYLLLFKLFIRVFL